MADQKVANVTLSGESLPSEVVRSGRRKDEGGAGVTWYCSCGAWRYSNKGHVCEHMTSVFAQVPGTGVRVDLTPDAVRIGRRGR